MNANPLDTLFESSLIAEIDLSFAKLMARLSGLQDDARNRLAVLTAMLSRTCTGDKSVRLELRSLSQESVAELFNAEELRPSSESANTMKAALALFAGLSAKDWLDALKLAGKVAAPAGEAGKLRPLVYDETSASVYLLRLWQAERRVAGGVLERGAMKNAVPQTSLDMLERLFPLYGGISDGPDLQKEAAKTVASGMLSIITGGPGTGKTSSVAAALCALLAAKPELRIGLCAPTGKAAAQLLASINAQRELFKSKGVTEATLARLPSEAKTIHRMLQWSPSKEGYLRNAGNQLDLDVLVVDEASMMPLSQADSLLAATPADARLILLGDKDQLASVESGSVFADLCAKASGGDFALAPHVAELKRTHRFKEGGPIASLKDAINRQNPDEAWDILASGSGEIELIRIEPAPMAKLRERLHAELKRVFDAGAFKGYLKEREPEAAFKLFDSLRILCSNRRGVFGVESVNGMLLELAFGQRAAEALKGLPGLPVIVTKNNYSVGLNNGDVGLALPSKNGAIEAYFRDGGDGFKSCPLPLLPEHEPAFAMTVHKAQGSGFDHALAILPPDPSNPLLTRELVYTAVTRAKTRLTVISSEAAFKAAVMRRTSRSSGLAQALGGA